MHLTTDRALNEVAGGAITFVSAALGVYYLPVLSVAHRLIMPAPAATGLSGAAAVSGLALMGLAWHNYRRPAPPERAHLMLAFIAAVLAANAGLVLAVTGEPEQTTNFILVQLGVGSIMLSHRWFTGTTLALSALWHTLAWMAPPHPEWTHFFFSLWAGVLLSAIVFVYRRRTQLRLTAYVARDRSRLEAERAEAESMFRGLVEQSLIGIVIIRDSGVFGYANPKAADIFGYPPDEMVGLPVSAIAHPDDRATVAHNQRRRLSGEIASMHYSFRGVRKSGEVIDLHVYGARGTFEGRPALLGALVDETEQRRVAHELAEKERRLSTLLSNLPGTVYRCRNDRAWTLEFMSEGVASLTGYAADELMTPGGRQFNDIIHPDERERVWNEVQTALADNRSYTLIYRIIRRDGAIRWVWEQGSGITGERGEVTALEGFISDITARMSAELALERSETRLRLALEAGQLGIWDVDLSNGEMEWTDGFAKLYGLPPEPLHGRIADLQKLVHPDDWPRLELIFERSMLTGGEVDMEFRVAVEGDEKWLSARGRRLPGAPGTPGRLTGWMQDITPRRRFMAALETAKQQAEEANRLKSSILANMSHEIRTPMTAILGYADLLARKLKGTPYEQDLRTIKSGGKRLLSLLNNILDLARIEAGKLALQRQSHPAEEALLRAAELFQMQAQKKGLTLAVDVAPGLWVSGDLQAEEQIFTNVVGNAIKFTDTGSVRVALAAGPFGATVRYTISDTGVGMAEAFMPYVFDEFRQESEGVSRRFEGSGLGLAIAKKLVDALGGRIAVESRKNHGTVVTIDLPVGVTVAAGGPAAAGEAEAPGLAAAGPPVLLVEDDESTGELLRTILAESRAVEWARNAEGGLSAAERHPFTVVLLDIHLRGSAIDGVELLRRLREKPAYRNAAIYALTAYALPGDRERFLAAGFDGYLAKPFEAHELRRLVGQEARA